MYSLQESSKGRIEHKIDTLKENIVEEMLQKLTGYNVINTQVVNRYPKICISFFFR